MVNLAFRIALCTLLLAGGALASETSAPNQGAKGMFYRQLQHPEEKLNNGVEYWIELKRNGTTQRVTSKFDFRSGDQIRLHVRPNTDGFAYVLLAEGSGGEHAMLFPDPRHVDDNQLKANVEVTIPGDNSYLAFDQNPGTERVMLVLSRQKIEPKNVSPDKLDEKDKVIIAARVDGSKDLVPGSFVVSYTETPSAPTTSIASAHSSHSSQPQPKPDDGTNVITVVQKDPANTLALEIRLQHGQ